MHIGLKMNIQYGHTLKGKDYGGKGVSSLHNLKDFKRLLLRKKHDNCNFHIAIAIFNVHRICHSTGPYISPYKIVIKKNATHNNAKFDCI